MSLLRNMAEMNASSPLNDCARFRRRGLFSGLPNAVTYGLAAVFEEAHSGGDDKENTEIGPVFFQHGCREKEQSAACCQEQSEYDTGFVAVFLHKHGNRYGEYEIGQPIGGFGERCFERVQFAGFHQLPDHGRQQVAADGPQEEEAENQYEWNDVFIFFFMVLLFIYSDMFLI